MKANILAGLEPAAVFGYFEQICAIPHGSRNTKPISDYLVGFAKEHGLRYIQDEANNVILFKGGSAGYEDHALVIIQGHMDMVCEKEPDCAIHFETDGLDLAHDGTDIFAHGTTLGGDDGIAVAYALAILADDSIPHPPLEIVITVDEEIGMLGADVIDLSELKGRTLINIDSEDEGVLTVSCAGGATAEITRALARHTVYGPCVKLKVDGLAGGHSGVEIHKNRANANKVMGQFLDAIRQVMPVCLTSIAGGSKDNAIPRSCEANLVAMGLELTKINDIAAELQEKIRKEYNDPEATVEAFSSDALGGNALSTEDSAKVIGLLCAVPNGVQAMSQDIEGLVQTSLNLGILRLNNEGLSMTFSVRSSVNQEKEELIAELQKTAALFDAEYSQMGTYPAWEYRKDSPLRDLMVSTFEDLFGKTPEVVAIHAGLECGLLGEKLPGLDCVSYGPNMQDIHTSREKLNIASTARMWEYLLEVLKKL